MEDGTFVYGLGSLVYNFIQLRMFVSSSLFSVLENMNLHKGRAGYLGPQILGDNCMSFKNILFSVHAHLNHGYYDLAKHITNSRFKFMIFCGELADGPTLNYGST